MQNFCIPVILQTHSFFEEAVGRGASKYKSYIVKGFYQNIRKDL
jgi:hypothetical protein